MLDAGFLVSVDRGDKQATEVVDYSRRRDKPLHTTSPVLAQVWRNGRTQAHLARFLKYAILHPFDDQADGRRVGELIAASGIDDALDAHVVWTASRYGLDIITSDPTDIGALAAVLSGRNPTIKTWP